MLQGVREKLALQAAHFALFSPTAAGGDWEAGTWDRLGSSATAVAVLLDPFLRG